VDACYNLVVYTHSQIETEESVGSPERELTFETPPPIPEDEEMFPFDDNIPSIPSIPTLYTAAEPAGRRPTNGPLPGYRRRNMLLRMIRSAHTRVVKLCPSAVGGIKRYRDPSVCLSVPCRSCLRHPAALGYRHAGCLQLSHAVGHQRCADCKPVRGRT